MDVVETITFTREDVDASGNKIFASAVYVPGESEQKAREEWSSAEIETIADKVAAGLDEALASRKSNPIQAP
jgi:hypothetical protein